MEKEVIIHFLDEHWDEFINLLSKTVEEEAGLLQSEQFPNQVYEFTGMLSKVLAAYRKDEDKRINSERQADSIPAQWVTEAQVLAAYDADTKGLLEKAQTFRRCGVSNDDMTPHSIVIKNGLFIVQPQQNKRKLNSAFKKLVDSVL